MDDNKLISKAFLWMFMGLLVTFVTGYAVSLNDNMLLNIFGSAFYIIVLVEFLLVLFLSARIFKMNPTTAKASFLLYSFVSGLTFSTVFVVYNIGSVMFVFLVTAALFGIMALLGYTTSIDLTRFGTYLFIGIIGVLLVSFINIFMGNSTLALVLSIICIILFMGITAYDVQKMKRLNSMSLPVDNLAIYGALDLYLDFINIFLHLLDIIGKNDN